MHLKLKNSFCENDILVTLKYNALVKYAFKNTFKYI